MVLSSPPSPRSPRRRRAALAVSGALALGACAPNLGPAPLPRTPASYAASESLTAPEADWPKDDWWRAYGDPQLDQLMQEALAGAPDLAVAAARVREAQAQTEQTRSAQRPQVTASSSLDEAQIHQSIGLPPSVSSFLPSGFSLLTNSTASLSYALDFFGKNRAALAQSVSLAAAARADQAAARLELTADVASAYGDFLRLSQDREEALDAVRVREGTLKLVSDRRRNGLETRAEYSEQNATVSEAQAQVDAYDLLILQTRHQIAALLGNGPDRGLEMVAPDGDLPLRPLGLPARVQLDLLGRRPDIAAARLRAEAARQRIKSARADFYPNVNLTASAQAISLDNQNPFQHNINLTEFGPAVSLPIFSGGRIEGAYRGARSAYDEAVGTYDRTLAHALSDVADALAARKAILVRLTDARAALASDEDAYAVAKLRYQGGLSSYLSVLTVESNLLAQRQAVIDLAGQAFTYDIALVRALGGGYHEAGPVAGPAAAR